MPPGAAQKDYAADIAALEVEVKNTNSLLTDTRQDVKETKASVDAVRDDMRGFFGQILESLSKYPTESHLQSLEQARDRQIEGLEMSLRKEIEAVEGRAKENVQDLRSDFEGYKAEQSDNKKDHKMTILQWGVLAVGTISGIGSIALVVVTIFK